MDELVDEWRVLATPVAEDMPGDLRRTADEELEAPDVRASERARVAPTGGGTRVDAARLDAICVEFAA